MRESGQPTKLFITGLCLQGNKGGPALALSMREVLSRYLTIGEIILSVPGGPDFSHEQRAAQRYGFKVVPAIGLKSLIPPFAFQKGRYPCSRAWFSAFRQADAIIDMTAISYVGPPIMRCRDIVTGRFLYFLISRLLSKKFLAWTQSYGPLSSKVVLELAKIDLKRQPIVFCRGEDCAELVRTILPTSDIRSFPDVATVLPYDSVSGAQKIAQIFGKHPDRMVTISPSAVIYARTDGEGELNAHVLQLAALCDWLAVGGYDVLLLPHTLRLAESEPQRCDLAVCTLVFSKINSKHKYNCSVLDEDLGAEELKGIIANAHLHIGGRYHSVVAALSTGVPAISLSWHPKYKDLMRTYGCEQFVFGATGNTSGNELENMVRNLESQRDALHSMLIERQGRVAALVDENALLFSKGVIGD